MDSHIYTDKSWFYLAILASVEVSAEQRERQKSRMRTLLQKWSNSTW